MKSKPYKFVVAAGTFDMFHDGHKAFLAHALTQSDNMLLGITSDSYTRSYKDNHVTEPYEVRKRYVQEFLDTQETKNTVTIVPIDSVYIPEKWEDYPFDAILVTKDSLKGAEMVNKKRVTQGKEPLVVLTFPLLLASDGKPISSSRIRRGIIRRNGTKWVEKEWFLYPRFLPLALRRSLQKPIGELIDSRKVSFTKEEASRIIAVGDVTTRILCSRGIVPRISIVDFLVQRKEQFTSFSELLLPSGIPSWTVKNPPGTLTPWLFQRLKLLFEKRDIEQKNVVLKISGEEDLSVLPAILTSPLSWIILYGQQGVGTVKVVVSEEVKENASRIVSSFVTES